MALDFPTSPANNEIYTANSRSWMWNADANAWVSATYTVKTPTTVVLSLSANTANLVNGAWTSVACDTETLDTDSWHAASNSRIVIGTTGNYVVTGKLYMYQHADMGAYATYAGIAVNGALIAWDFQSQRVPSSYVSHSVTAGAYLTAGQYVELQGYSQYLGKILSNTTILTSLTLVSAGLTGATGPTGPDSPYNTVLDVTGTTTQNLNNLAINADTALINFSSVHASNNYLTGITGGIPGRRLTIRNGQTSGIYVLLATANASSDAANRIAAHRFTPCELGNGRCLDLLYANSTLGWVICQTSLG